MADDAGYTEVVAIQFRPGSQLAITLDKVCIFHFVVHLVFRLCSLVILTHSSAALLMHYFQRYNDDSNFIHSYQNQPLSESGSRGWSHWTRLPTEALVCFGAVPGTGTPHFYHSTQGFIILHLLLFIKGENALWL